jgi:hypothetical protein
LFVADAEFIFFIDEFNHGSFSIYLLHLNLQNSKCSLIDTKELTGQFRNISFDCNCRRRFYVHTLDNDHINTYLQEVKIEDLRLNVTPLAIQFNYLSNLQRINGQQMQTLEIAIEMETNNLVHVFSEYNLASGNEATFVGHVNKILDKKYHNFRARFLYC